MDLPTLWFCFVSVMVAMYVVFDGFDIGAGIAHLFLARGEDERRLIRRSLGPVWDGNEVWLLAGGGTLYFAFPAVYARSFSGFYLPLMIVLWLLIGRAVALELASHVRGPIWQPFWSRIFGISSLLLALFFGAALGNVVRGVPMNAEGRFFAPLWTDFGVKGQAGILDWYTVLVGGTAVIVLFLHGCLWIALKTDGALQARTRRAAKILWGVAGALVALLTFATFRVQPHVPERLVAQPAGLVLPALFVGAFLALRRFLGRGRDGRAFLMSALAIVGLLTSAVFGLYPYLLPSNGDPKLGLEVHGSAAPAYGLRVGLFWWLPGMALVTAYFVYTYRHFAGKTTLEGEGY